MRLISAVYSDPQRAIKPHQLMAENLRRSAERAGYEITIHNLEHSPIVYADPSYYRLDCSFKPYLIRQELEKTAEDLCWIDADCLVVSRFDEILGGADVACTLRPVAADPQFRHIYDGYINAGVMAFRNSRGARAAVHEWIERLPDSRSDQDAMNRLLLEGSKLETQEQAWTWYDIKFRVVPTQVYNFFHFPGDWSRAKVLHIKGIHKPEEYDAIARQVLGDESVPTAGAKEEACR